MKGFSNPTHMTHQFSRVNTPKIQRSKFFRNFTHKSTLEAGWLYPVFVDEVLPGDTFKVNATFLVRFATLIVPLMDNVYFDTFYFFVPNRLVWENWVKFMGEKANPDDSIDYLLPKISGSDGISFDPNSIYDYMGLPINTSIDGNDSPTCLPMRAYALIFNEWFRDENLQNSADLLLNDGPDDLTNYPLLRRGKRHDYFTSCLPWPQKGDAVSLPIGTSAPVIGDGKAIGLDDGTHQYGLGSWSVAESGVYTPRQATTMYGQNVGHVITSGGISPPGSDVIGMGLSTDPTKSGMFADLSSATAATVNALRQAITIQQLLELDARGGTRYTEILQAHFGVYPEDFRLQRPEYLGGGSQRINISQVAQTSPSATDPDFKGPDTPQGNLAGFGHGAARSGFMRSFKEHGFVIGIANIRADITYQQGISRMWTRRTRYDFYDPIFANLGEQAVLNREIFYDAGGTPDAAFGYQERWAEYRYKNSYVSSAMRTGFPTGSLDFWHLALHFAAQPVLNDAFIQDNPPMNRPVAVDSDVKFIMDSFFQYECTRPMPMYSNPGLFRF